MKPRTFKKSLKDSCTKTPFLFNNDLYHQIDGVAMGARLGPTLENILMTALEKGSIRPLIAVYVNHLVEAYCGFMSIL